MKKLFYLFVASSLILAASCKKEETKYAENPLKSISVTSGEETITGVVNDTDKTVTFTFNNAEDFSNVNLAVELNNGWTLTYPTTLEGVDLQSTPALRFTDPKNAIVRYTVSFSSNAFPIIDPSKIQIKGLNAGESFTVDNTTKTITIKFDESKMDFNDIELIFNDGSLQNGVELPESLAFDFSQGNEHKLILKLGGDRTYTVKLDVSSYVSATPEQMGFLDVSSNFVNADQSYIKVYSASGVSSVPIALYETSRYWGWNGYGVSTANPRDWSVSPADTGYEDDVFQFPGDWANDRPTMNCFGDIAIVTVDAGKVKADLKSAQDGVNPAEIKSAVVTSGWIKNANIDYLIKDNNTFINNPEGDHAVLYRASVAADNGKLSFVTAGEKSGKLYSIPFQTEKPNQQDLLNSATEEITASDVAWVCAWGVRAGKSMKIQEIINNDASQYVSDLGVLGMGWGDHCYGNHNLAGITYDGKLAFMINIGGGHSYDGGDFTSNGYNGYEQHGVRFKGYSIKQMLWIAQKLGWRDAAVLGNTFSEAGDFTPSLLVNGKSVIDGAVVKNTSYAIAVDAK